MELTPKERLEIYFTLGREINDYQKLIEIVKNDNLIKTYTQNILFLKGIQSKVLPFHTPTEKIENQIENHKN